MGSKLQKNQVVNQLVSYIPALTGVRAIAAYMVYLHHFNPFIEFSDKHNSVGYYAFAVCREMHIGVTIFFSLSGFLIGYRYLNRVEFSKKWFFAYFRNRIARIYPVYFLLTLIVFAIWAYNHDSAYIGSYNDFKTPEEAFLIFGLNITFLRGFSDTIKFSGIAPGWSLTVEETFYILAPFILWWVSTKRKRLWILPPLFAAIGLLLVGIFSIRPVLGVMSTYEFMWSYTFFGRCFEFVGGIFLAISIHSNPRAIRTNALFTALGSVCIILCLNLLIVFTKISPRIIINNLLLTSAILLFFYGLMTERTIVQRLLESKPLQLLGKSSYAFYLIHVGFVSVWLEEISSPFCISFLFINIASIMLYKFIEEPANQFIRKKINY